MWAWRALLFLWNKSDSGYEVRRKHFLGKVPKLDRGWVMCCKAMSKEPAVACINPPPYIISQTTENQSHLPTFGQDPSLASCIRKAVLLSVPQKWSRKIGLSVTHSPPLSPLSYYETNSRLDWDHVLVTINLPSLHKFAVHSLQCHIIYSWFTVFFSLKQGEN